MMKPMRWLLLLIGLFVWPVQAQDDALNLPADLYVLTNEGRVERYGLGAAGVQTITPAEAFVLDFGVGPDGEWLAYRTESALTLLNRVSGENRVLETDQASFPALRGRGETLAWSPNGDALATTTLEGGRVYFGPDSQPVAAVDLREGVFYQFLWSPDSRYLAGEVADNVWWIYRREGTTLTLTSAILSSIGLAFASDYEVAFAPADGGLSLMNLNSGNSQTPLLDTSWNYGLPYLAPGRILRFFGRQKDDTVIQPGFGRLLGLESSSTEIANLGQVAIELEGLRWAPGAQLLVSFRDVTLAMVNPVSGSTFVLPISNAVAYGWGPLELSTSNAPLPFEGFFLAGDENSVAQVWRFPQSAREPEIITSKADGVGRFGVSADGLFIAYSSGDRLLLRALAQAQPQQLATLSAEAQVTPAFSPNNQRIAYADGGIWEVSVGGQPRQIVADVTGENPRTYSHPVFAPNIDALLVRITYSDSLGYGLLDATSGAVIELPRGQTAMWLSDGRIVLYGSGLSVADPNALGQAVLLVPADVTVEAARQMNANNINILQRRQSALGPRLGEIYTLNLTDGSLALAHRVGYMTDTLAISANGGLISGYARRAADGPGGMIGFFRPSPQILYTIRQPAQIWDFVWTQR